MKDFTIAEAHGIMNMSPSIVGYFNYYAGKYPTETGTHRDIITIPMKDGSRSLDHYFIKPLLAAGWLWKDSFLLGEIYLYKDK